MVDGLLLRRSDVAGMSSGFRVSSAGEDQRGACHTRLSPKYKVSVAYCRESRVRILFNRRTGYMRQRCKETT